MPTDGGVNHAYRIGIRLQDHSIVAVLDECVDHVNVVADRTARRIGVNAIVVTAQDALRDAVVSCTGQADAIGCRQARERETAQVQILGGAHRIAGGWLDGCCIGVSFFGDDEHAPDGIAQ